MNNEALVQGSWMSGEKMIADGTECLAFFLQSVSSIGPVSQVVRREDLQEVFD
jgi:hypothetical protein